MIQPTQDHLRSVCDEFQIPGDFLEARPYGSGHINDTFKVSYDQGGVIDHYILQRINHHVFNEPPRLMDNVLRITDELRRRLAERGVTGRTRRVLQPILSHDGQGCHQDAVGDYWRVFVFIQRAHSHNTIQSAQMGYQAARAFGAFQRDLGALHGPPLHESIPDFHNAPLRYLAFENALDKDPLNRARHCRDEIARVQRQAAAFDILAAAVARGELPLRTVHNDTKINNVLIDDDSGEGLCVIDLDTVMPGLFHYDFGDTVRTTISDAEEDETRLDRVQLNHEFFEAILGGYLEGMGEALEPAEYEYLVFSGQIFALMVGTRFLTDHLLGDRYFRIHHPGHNLERCRTQLRLFDLMRQQEDQLQALVHRQRERLGLLA